jgi:hypothetical protein
MAMDNGTQQTNPIITNEAIIAALRGISADSWARNGITFQKWKQDTSDNYLASLPLLTSKRARLVDNAVIRTQLTSLERKVVGGHEEVTHPSSASSHDDVAAVVCGALVVAAGQQSSSAWMEPANLRRVRKQAEAMPRYQRPLGDQRARNAEAIFGERRLAQIMQQRQRRW